MREGDRIDGRYVLGREDRAVGALRRCPGMDAALDRPVLLWLSEGADEDLLLDTARLAGALSDAAFLRVLDVAYEGDTVAVVLEHPGDSFAEARLASIEAGAARSLLAGVDRASESGLALCRAGRGDLFAVDGEVLIDPIALALPAPAGERVPAAALVRDRIAALLIEHAEDAVGLSRALRGAVRDHPGARAAALAAAGGGTVYVDAEPTEAYSPPAAAHAASAATARVAGEPAPAPADRRAAPSPAAPAPEPAEDRPARRRGALPWRVFVPIYGVLLVMVVGALAFAMRSPSSPVGEGTTTPVAGQPGGSGPPAVVPAAGHVTVGLLAKEDSGVRVTVDGIVQFDGTLAAGQRQAWDGRQRIDVWTDKGRTVEIAVNGKALGPYSPAMGHPDWNRIDFSFWPGFGQ